MSSLQHEKEEAERNGRGIEDDVTNWLERARNAVKVAEEIVQDHKRANKNCYMGCCPNLKTRYWFSRKAMKHTSVFAKVQDERSSITNTSFALNIQNLQAPKNCWKRRFSNINSPIFKNYEAFDTRTAVLNKIVGALKNVDFNLIGVFGPPGVGKTTLATKHLVNEVKRLGVFEVVACATVTQTADLKSIQGQIAEWLDFKFEVDSTQVRAVRLCDRLKKEEKVLVILDDIWKPIELEEIGIPNDKDSKGCKIFMTSRIQGVLSSMGVQEQFVLENLKEDEAWELFRTKLGVPLHSDLQDIAFEVSKRYAGFPGLITSVAISLRNQELCVCKDSLDGLMQFDHREVADHVNLALKFSYDFLQLDAKSVFLLCGQNGARNIDIKYLLKYGLGLGIFKSCKTVEAARNKLHSLLCVLKASCLLLESDNEDGVLHMHDLVHHFAITTASENQPVITSNRMSDWPEDDTLENCKAMVLMDGKVPPFSGVLHCPKLRFFLLNNGNLSLEIGDNFFEGMKGLRVLNLTNASFLSLPLSLQFLKDLETLCLDSCVLEDVTLIGELTKLQVLSLVNCTIVRLPGEIGNLTHLKLLDLKGCSSLEVIEPNVLSRLTRLEELYVENSSVKWEDTEANNGKRVNANLTELEHLSKLVTVHMHIADSEMLPRDLQLVKQFENFKILIGEEWDLDVEYKTSRTLKLKLNTSDHLQRVRSLLMRTEDLYLGHLNGVKNVLNNLDGDGFPHLKHLLLDNSQDIQYIIDWRWMDHVIAFPKLESLSLNNLNKLETVSSVPLKMGSFGSLRRLEVGNCSLLRNLFSISMFRCLEQLEEMDVSSCKIIKMIIDDDGGQDEAINLDKLRSLKLNHLPNFASFCLQVKLPTIARTGCAEIISEDETETSFVLFNEKIDFPNLLNLTLTSVNVENIWSNQLRDASPCTQNLTSLVVDGCWNLKYVFTSSMVQHLAQLKKLEISNCSSMREIILTEGLEEEIMTRKILFPKLDLLKLKHLPTLERFFSGKLLECPLLKDLRVENCLYLQAFVSSSMGTHVGTQPDTMTLFDEKVALPNLVQMEVTKMKNLRIIWSNQFHSDSFSKLEVLKVENDKQLLEIFPHNLLTRFQNLNDLTVKKCKSLEVVFDIHGLINAKEVEEVTSQLKKLDIREMPNLRCVWNEDPKGVVSFVELSSMYVWNCPNLKSLFPFSIAKSLQQLENLELDSCGLVELVTTEKEIAEEASEFVYPRLKYFDLWKLRKLEFFYRGIHTLDCPVLTRLSVYQCDELEVFTETTTNPLERYTDKSMFSFSKIISNLELVSLTSKDVVMIRESQFPPQLFDKLKVVELHCFHNKSDAFPFDLLKFFPYMESLYVRCSMFKQLFPLEGLDKTLQNLKFLKVTVCHNLISLAPPTASFQNLTNLDVDNCDNLVRFMGLSTARSLAQLQKMSIRHCDKVSEIVSNEESDDESKEEIVFTRLQSLELSNLRSLVSFCPAECSFKFPSMTQVIVTCCPNIKFFSKGVLTTPKLKKVQLSEADKGHWNGNLNRTVKKLYREIDHIQHFKLSDFPELKDKWLAQFPVP